MPVFTRTLSVVHQVSRRVRTVGTRLVQTAVVVGACLAMPRAAAAASGLASGATLPSGQVLTSGNGHYTFANQVDGNLVLYVDGYPLWASETSRPGALVLEANGDLVLSDGAGVVWSSGTSMYAGATLAVQDDGNVVLYGSDHVPVWSTETSDVHPSPLPVPPAATHAAVAAGSSHILLLRTDGTVWAAVTASNSASYALTAAGVVWSWGYYTNGALGDGSTTIRTRAAQVPALTDVVAITAGASHVLALKTDHTVWGWGANANAQVGTGSATVAEWTPVQATSVGLVQALASSLRGDTSYAMRVDGSVLAWGDNQYGTIGNGTTSSYVAAPTSVVIPGGAVGVAAAAHTAYAWNADGMAWGWGDNGSGRVGDGTNTPRSSPTAIASPAPIGTVAGGGSHVLGIATSGLVLSWGWNGVGQLGDGTMNTRYTPGGVAGLSGPVSIAAGANVSVAVLGDGSVWAWGDNYNNQFGDGSNWDSLVPVRVVATGGVLPTLAPTFSKLPGTYTTASITITNATAGAVIHYTTAGSDPTEADSVITSGGSVTLTQTTTLKAAAWASGRPASNVRKAEYVMQVATPTYSPGAGTYGTPPSVTITCTTPSTSLYYTLDGTTPTTASTVYTGPVTIATGATLKAIAVRAGWEASGVASGTYAINTGTLSTPTTSAIGGIYETQVTVALAADPGATIRYTTNNATPTSTSTEYLQPLVIATTTTVKAKAFRTDYTASGVLTEVYTIRAGTPTLTRSAGAYDPGTRVTIASTDPAATLRFTLTGSDPTPSDTSIASGTSLVIGGFTLKVRAFRTGTTDSTVAAAAYTLTAPLGGGAITAGGTHSLLATPTGALYGWGLNSSSQVGDGTTTNRTAPVLIPTLTGVTALAAGSVHSLALTYDGLIYAWGSNGSGRLGDGTTTTRTRPVPIAVPSPVVAIAAGGSHSLALTASGQVYTWGAGSSGQLGLGNTASASTPTLIVGLANVVAIAAGANHSLAATSGGQVYAWGANASSQVGDGSTTTRTSPVLLASLSNVVAVSAGTSHSLARTASGAVYAWGLGSSGQLGLGATATKTTPTLVSGVSVTSLTAGSTHTLAMTGGATLMGFGANGSGQIGDGTTTNRLAAVPVQDVTNAALVSAGGSHSLAVTADGHVWSWGAGASGQLGDGTTSASRATPQEVFTQGGTWGGTPPPVLTLAPGTYHQPQVASATAMPGAVIRYTTTGATPTTADPELGRVRRSRST